MAKRKTSYLSDDWGKTERKSSGAYLSEDWGKADSKSQAQRDEETRQKRAQTRIQQAEAKAWDNKEALRQRTGGVSTGPVSPLGREAAMADFYRRQAEYGAAHGNQALYDEGYEKYKAAVGRIDSTAANLDRLNRFRDSVGDVARAARSPYRTLTGRTGTEDALRDLEAMGRRTERDSALYSQIAGAAAQAGSKKSYQLAEHGMKQSAGRYAQAMHDYGQAEQEERQRYLEELRQNNRGAWYGERLSREQIEGQIRQIEGKLATIEEMQQNPNWSTGMGGTAEDKAGQTAKRYDQLRGELEQYRAALRHRNALDKADEMRQLAESVQSGGNFRQMAEVGRAMVEARNRQAREAVDPSLYAPDDPDDNNQFLAALDRENEALARFGYVADLDSSYIPEDVKPIYYALFAQSPAKAKEWAEYWKGIGEDEYWRQIYEASGEDAGSRLGAFIQGTFANTVAGLDPFGEGGQYAAKLGSTMIGGGAAGLTEKGLFNTGTLAGEIDVPIFGKQSLGSAYQLGSSMLQSAANATLAKMTGGAAEIVGGMGTILLGSSAAAQDYQQKLEQGWDESSAKWHALAAGAAEAGFEYLSLDKLVNQDVSRGFIRNVLLQGGIEASEEVNTTIANRITDAAISALSGYDNSIQQRAKELMAFGYEAGTAEKMAQQEWLTELLNDALGGFLSGGMMTGGQYAMLPVYKAVGAVDDFKRFTGALSSTGETAITGTEDLTRGKAGALAGQIGASLNAETVEAARRIMGEEAQNNVDGGQIARATEQNDRRNTDSSAAAEASAQNDAAEQKQSRREQRRQAREQRKQSTRDGAVFEQAVQKVQQAIDQRGVGAVNEVYAETVEQYGEAAKGIAQEAITRAVSRQLSEARNVADIDRMTQAENAAPEVRAAIQQAKDLRSYQLFAQNGDTEAAERAIQSRRNSGRSSGALKLEAEYSGEDGSVKRAEIVGVTANAESVKLSNGETVSVKQLANLDADTRDVLDRIAYMEVGPAADILWKSYLAEAGSGTDGYRYVMDWATAYDQGRQGSISLKEAQGRSSLSAETVKRAYELGEQYGKDLDAKQKAELAEKMKITQKGATGRAGSVNTEQIGGMKLSEDQSKQLEIVKRLAEAFGIDVEVFASGTKEVTANGETKRQFVGENGRYQDGKIWLDINAGLNYTDDIGSGLVATMGHELTHFIQEYAPEEYRAYKRFVLATIRQQEGSQGLERLIREKIQRSKGQNLSRSAAEDEVVADAAQTVLTDSQALQQMAEQEPTLFRKVLDWIKDFFDSIREALSSSPRMSEEARLFRALEADVRKTFGELWDKGITEAVRVHDQVGSQSSTAVAEVARDVEAVGASAQMAEEATVQNSDRIDAETLEFLDNQEHVTVYRAMQLIDGKLYPPMAAKVEGKLVEPTEIGKWYQSVERPDLVKNGKFTLNKGNGTSVPAAYNPYFHCSASPLNDQFSSAYKRPNLVVVEGIIPKSELTSGYRANGAKNSVGETQWHAGPVASKLKGAKARRVFLSRYFQVSRIMSDAEVAGIVANTLQGENVSIPSNVVTPSLLAALKEQGVAVDETGIERFEGQHKKKNAPEGVRNSDRDAEYLELAKAPEKNQARLQEMVDEAAKEAGYTYEVWHGTNGGDFTVFDWKKTQRADAGWYGRGHYFATHAGEASAYGKRLIHSYLRIRNPFNFQTELLDVNGQRLPIGPNALRFMQQIGKLDPEYFGNRILEAYDNWTDQDKRIKWADIEKEIDDILNGMKLRQYADGHCEWAYDYGGFFEESTKNEYKSKEAAKAAKEAAAYELLQKRLNARLPMDPAAYYLGGDMNASDRFTEVLKSKGYDGVLQATNGSEIVVFDSPQIKSADPVTYDDAGNVIPLSERFNAENQDIRYSERDYDLPSDLELMDRAAESLSEAGGEEYWAALLEAAPELADDKAELKSMAKAYREQSRKLAEAERKLSEARQQLVTTDRKLRTRGIAGVTTNILKDLHAGDVKNRNVQQTVTDILTEAYQKALDATDEGQSPGDVWEIVYNEGIVKAADYIYENATYSEKAGRGWNTTFISQWMQGQEGRQAVIDEVSAKVVMDWMTKRMRGPIQMTAADRIVSRVEGRMQKQIDAQTQRAESADASNQKLREDLDFWRTAQDNAAKQVTFLGEQLEEARDDLRNTKQTDAKERKRKAARIRSLENQLKAKREEAGAWKQMASRNEQLLRAALKSKNADLEAQAQRADKAEAALAGQTVNAKAWERNADLYAKQLDKQLEQKARIVKQLEAQVQREQDILSGKLKPLAMQRLLKAAREEAAGKAKAKKEEVFQNYKERQKQSRLRSRIKNLADDLKRKMTNPTERAYVPASLYSSMTLLCDALDDLLAPNDGTKAAARYRAVMDGIHGLSAEYQAVKDLDDPTFSSEYDEEIQYEINEIIRTLQGYDEEGNPTRLFTKARELSSGELQKVYDIMKYINYCMTTAKDMMGSSQYKTVYDAMRAVAEQQRSLPRLIDEKGIRRWNRSRLLDNLSVMRGVEMMSGWDRDAALYQLMHAIENGTDESWAWVMDYNKTQQALKTGKNEKSYRDALTKKLDYNVTDEEGRKVLMTKLQALQILMTAEREAHNDKLLHLQAGGAKVRDAIDLQNGKGAQARSQTIRVTPELIQRIQESVTDWDRAYMKNVRDYFRKEGKRTNEILYRLKHRVLQTENYYVPYKVDDNYLETKLTEQQAMNMWVKTPGSTNALKQKAKQPVIIDGMDTVMGRHVKEMGDYIGLAIPVRDFSKVYNGRLRTGEDNPLPVKKTIDDAFGKKGQHLLTQAVIDVQGGSGGQSWRSGISDFLNKLQGGFVRSALLINPSVTIKQAASYIAAESVLSHRALVLGNRATIASTDKTRSPALIAYLFANPEGKTAQRIYSEIDQHTSLHYQRRQGMSQAEIANEANRNGRVKRWMNGIGASMERNRIGHAVRKAGENLNPVTWIQRMDVATTAALWVACKQQAKMDGMQTGTEEFWKHTTELYERVIRETQPMYDSLHRTAHQKQSGTLTQFLFPFRTVPIQNHGQLAASYEALKASRNKSKAEQKQAGKFFAKTVWAQTESAAIFALMTFIAAALKRKTKKYRDEDEELNAKSVGMGLGKDVASTLFSVLQPMYGSELVSIGSRALDKFSGSSGYTYDAFSVGVVDMINDLISASDKLLEDAGKANRGESVSFADVSSHGLSLLLKGAKLAGIPADTVRTYWEGLVGNAKDAMEGRIPALNDESWERSAAVNAERYLKAWIAGDLNKVDRVEAEMLGNYTEAGKSEKKANEAMKTKMTATAKAAWESGRLDEQDTIDFLTETGYYDEDEAWKTVQRWEGNAAHKGEEDYNYSQYEALNDDLNAGKSFAEAAADYLAHGYKEEDLRENAVKNAKKRYLAGDLTEDEAIDLLLDYAWKKENGQYRNFTKDEAWMKVKEWRESADYTEEDGSWGQYDAIDEALAGNKEVKGLISELTAHGVKEDSINQHIKGQLVQNYVDGKTNESQLKNQLSRYLGIVAKTDVDKILKDANTKKLYGVAYSSLDEEYRAGKIGKAEIKQALMKQGGLSSGEADQKIRWYDLQKANPKLDISEAVCNAWYDGTTNGSQKYGHESAKDAGMNIERYLEARKYLDTIKDANGNGTGEDEVIQALAGMRGLTAREKDALYYERYKGGTRKGIYKTW